MRVCYGEPGKTHYHVFILDYNSSITINLMHIQPLTTL